MTTFNTFQHDLHRGYVFESGIGHALARLYSGQYQSYDYLPGVGQPSGDGRLTIGAGQYNCEFKAEVNRYANFFFETNGAYGRESASPKPRKKKSCGFTTMAAPTCL